MSNSTITLIERRISANRFDPSFTLTDAEIARLVDLATRAPSAFNLQNWRFVAVRTASAKARLRDLADGQAKVSEAAVTFIVCGLKPDCVALGDRLQSFVAMGCMQAATVFQWQEAARALYADDAQAARDEAIRSGTLAAATLIYAAESMDLVSGPMIGFDAEAVARDFELGPDEIPVLLLAVGRAGLGNWPQKPRRPVTEVLQLR